MRVRTKQQVQIEQQILYNLSKIVEMYPQYTMSQHFVHFLRRKGEPKEVYYWTDEFLLKKVEDYYDELRGELITFKEEN